MSTRARALSLNDCVTQAPVPCKHETTFRGSSACSGRLLWDDVYSGPAAVEWRSRFRVIMPTAEATGPSW